MSKSVAQVLDLKNDEELIKEYEEYHKKVWPEVLEGIKEAGIERMEIFRSGNHLFMYCLVGDNFDPNNDFPQQSKNNEKSVVWEFSNICGREDEKFAAETKLPPI